MTLMNPCITFTTPKRYDLQGLWLGKPRAKTAYIFVHGLYSNLFSQAATASALATGDGASMLFNNRGNGYVSKIRRMRSGTGAIEVIGGSHEVFTDCRDDVAGAVAFAKARGASRIVLVGHSTGCQKATWYLAHKPAREVVGAVLLAPLSDYAALLKEIPPSTYRKALAAAIKAMRTDPHALLPTSVSPIPCDAQRWLSLYTPESDEEIFTYASGKIPKTLRRTHVPLLALFASEDQYADRPAEALAAWFTKARPKQPIETKVVDAPDHGFSGASESLATIIRTWAASL